MSPEQKTEKRGKRNTFIHRAGTWVGLTILGWILLQQVMPSLWVIAQNQMASLEYQDSTLKRVINLEQIVKEQKVEFSHRIALIEEGDSLIDKTLDLYYSNITANTKSVEAINQTINMMQLKRGSY